MGRATQTCFEIDVSLCPLCGGSLRIIAKSPIPDPCHGRGFLAMKQGGRCDVCPHRTTSRQREGKTIVPVYLEEVELTADLKVGLSRVQALDIGAEDYRDQLIGALGAGPMIPEIIRPPPRKLPRLKHAAAGLVAVLVVLAVLFAVPRREDSSPIADGNQAIATSNTNLASLMSIAVLPFTNLSEQTNVGFFAKCTSLNAFGHRFRQANGFSRSLSRRSPRLVGAVALTHDPPMALDDFDTPTAWRHDLDLRWPERLEMKSVLLAALAEHAGGVPHAPTIMELGIGDGELLAQVAESLPKANLVAADNNPELLAFSRARMVGARTDFIEQDLREPWVSSMTEDCDAVYSLQTFHDIGGRETLVDVYARIAEVLRPGGLLLNADFVVPMNHDDPEAPRRFPPAVHIEILNACGFDDAASIAQVGRLGCIAARWRGC